MYPPRNPKFKIKQGVPIVDIILFGAIPFVIIALKFILD